MDRILPKLRQAKEYTFTKPVKIGPTKLISDPNHLDDSLGPLQLQNTPGLIMLYGQKVKNVGLSPGYLTIINDPVSFSYVTKLIQDVFVPYNELDALGQWFYNKMNELIGQKLYVVCKGGLRLVDIVKDVF